MKLFGFSIECLYFCNRMASDIEHFNQLFRLYYEPLYRYALFYITDEEVCRDIASAAFEMLWKRIDSIEMTTAKTLLYIDVRNKCIDHLRREQCHERYIKYVEHISEPFANEHQQLEHEEMMKLATQLVDKMKSPTREILEACYIENKKYKEVAEQMSISVATVKKHMVRALKQLRKLKKS